MQHNLYSSETSTSNRKRQLGYAPFNVPENHRCFSTQSVGTSTDKTPSSQVAKNAKKKHTRVKKQNKYNRGTNYWEPTKEECLSFLQQVNQNNFPVGMVASQAKKLLVNLVNVPPHVEKGPLASRLLEVAMQELDMEHDSNTSSNSKNRNPETTKKQQQHLQHQRAVHRSKLFQLTIEAWLGTPNKGYNNNDNNDNNNKEPKPWDEAERMLWELLKDAAPVVTTNATTSTNSRFFTDRVVQNVPNINGAFALVVFHFCKDDNSNNKHPLSQATASRLKPLIDRIQQLWKDRSVALLASSSAVDAILYYHFKMRQATEAHHLFESTILYRTNPKNRFVEPTLHGMNTVISAHAKDGNVKKVQQIIDDMLAVAETQNLPSPNVVSFNGLLDAIHTRGGKHSGELAEDVLQTMENLSIQPTIVSLTTVVSTWAKSDHPDAAERSEAILRYCIDEQRAGTRSGVAPNSYIFCSVIAAWSRSGRADAAERAMVVIDMVKALYERGALKQQHLTEVFNSLIVTLGRSKKLDMWNQVTELLDYMKQGGIPIDASTHNSVMIGVVHVQGGDNDGPQRALDYFFDLERKQLAGDSKTRLNVLSYNVALDALSKCKGQNDAPTQALELLQRMLDDKEIEPTTVTFNTVMKIIARSSLENAAQRCEGLLEEMEQAGNSLKPSGISYSICISAWGYSRAPERFDRMQQLLTRMEKASKGGTQDHNNTKEGLATIVSFNNVLIGCCHGSKADRERALQCILETLSHLRRLSDIKPNQNTYPNIMNSIGLATKPGERRDSLLLGEFEQCANDGLVCPNVVESIQQFSPNILLARLSEGAAVNTNEIVQFDQLPKEWSRNVDPKMKRAPNNRK